MDALKSAGRAIIRSPSMAKQSWTAGRHRKLPENWTDTRETILEGMTFNLRHLGMTLVDQPKGEDLSAAAVKRIVVTAKASGKKPQKVALKISPQGIVLYDSLTNKLLENVSIYRISYCTVDKLHDKVFAYIAQNTLNGTLECHAYLCSKRKVAQAVALTVAQAFTVAFELWQEAKEEKGKRAKSGSAGEASSSSHSERSNSLGSLKGTDVTTDNLLDLEDSVKVVMETNGNLPEDQLDNRRNNNSAWETEDGLDEAFSSLAMSRTNPQVLDTGLTPPDWLAEPNWDSTNRNTPNSLSPLENDIFSF
ncbi:low density lipoprotein receptor adapter protein 1a isoform X1 [Takifugu flavidus]|uniref:low density lipoprotein receptor adapter protein 1a isoform X1 n=1 Tax=Takifugu flavidus TaxID=433684 RepID=UPI002544380B|nr:low density lipoprotein receptor adapter protein 1a isoform X1 [Takifugu flavidus]XP_056877612.1 low density lipoprotein receptor adapter protein 1a isoform X1 [Takifugu flavidus]